MFNLLKCCAAFILLAGMIICPLIHAKENDRSSLFNIAPLSENLTNELSKQGVWQTGCPVKLQDLRLVTVSYYDLLAQLKTGQLIVQQAVAPAVLTIFEDLYQARFPIARVDTLLNYQGDWQKAEAENVTYGFVCFKTSADQYGKESYGKVIMLNPIQNPAISVIELLHEKPWYCGILPFLAACQAKTADATIQILPAAGMLSINRSLGVAGMAEPAVAIFQKHGFKSWSGSDPDQLNWKKFSVA
jgi:hypothetical protein